MSKKTRPEIDFPVGEAPEQLIVEDLLLGEDPTVNKGDTVSVHYVGVAFSTGEEFDASWNREETFDFQVGAGMVIKGWDEGLIGMKLGGRRKLTIPPALGYGARAVGTAIKAHETLIFIVDLEKIN